MWSRNIHFYQCIQFFPFRRFVANYLPEVFETDEWKDLVESNPRLANKILEKQAPANG